MVSFSFLYETAKTEHKAEMEVPATTKVKVTDFFQRLVCGLLIFFHSHRGLQSGGGCFIHRVTQKALICLQDVRDDFTFIRYQELIFVLLLNKANHGWDWVSLGLHGFPWKPIGVGLQRSSLGLHWVCKTFCTF